MTLLTFIIWSLLYFPLIGIIDGLEVSSKRISNPTVLGFQKEFFKNIQAFCLFMFFFIAISLHITLSQALIMIISSPFIFYFLHNGAYFYTRSKSENIKKWSFKSSSCFSYTRISNITYEKRLKLFIFGFFIIIVSSFLIG